LISSGFFPNDDQLNFQMSPQINSGTPTDYSYFSWLDFDGIHYNILLQKIDSSGNIIFVPENEINLSVTSAVLPQMASDNQRGVYIVGQGMTVQTKYLCG